MFLALYIIHRPHIVPANFLMVRIHSEAEDCFDKSAAPGQSKVTHLSDCRGRQPLTDKQLSSRFSIVQHTEDRHS